MGGSVGCDTVEMNRISDSGRQRNVEYNPMVNNSTSLNVAPPPPTTTTTVAKVDTTDEETWKERYFKYQDQLETHKEKIEEISKVCISTKFLGIVQKTHKKKELIF